MPAPVNDAVRLRILGMTCGSCVARVERALRSVPAVREAAVNLLTETASVAGAARPDDLVAAVRAAGYDAEAVSGGATGPSADSRHAELLRRQRQSLVQALGFGLPILALDHFGHHLQAGHAAGDFGWRLLQAGLMTLLLFSSAGAPIMVGGARALWRWTGHMDALIALGVGTAYVGSLYGVFARQPAFVHFHAAAMILALIALGRYLETRARTRAVDMMTALSSRTPRRAFVRRGADVVEVDSAAVAAGDECVVPADHAAPTDGVVVSGQASVDESLLTGESMPVTRSAGDAILGGSVVIDGRLHVRASRAATDSAMARIVRMVADAQQKRTRMQRIADQIAGVFTPVVIAAAAMTFAGWLAWGGSAAIGPALQATVAVLVVACPCAMGLATPTAIVAASGLAAGRGILVRDPAALETLGRVDAVVWDKTGTLTTGRPAVVDGAAVGAGDADESLRLAASAEQFATHPVAKAIVAHARRRDAELTDPTEFKLVPGGGVTATIGGRTVVVGSRELLHSFGIETLAAADAAPRPTAPGLTEAFVAVDGRLTAIIRLRDDLRPSAIPALSRLRGLGIESLLLTGDRGDVAAPLARALEINKVQAGASPAAKVAFVSELRTRGRRVAMIGDGVNDAAALAAADVGVAFAAGSEITMGAAEIAVIGSSPQLVADAVVLARAAVRVIRQNLAWAFGYNLIAIPWAAVGGLPPELAAGFMMFSSIAVVLNALRLRRVVGWQNQA